MRVSQVRRCSIEVEERERRPPALPQPNSLLPFSPINTKFLPSPRLMRSLTSSSLCLLLRSSKSTPLSSSSPSIRSRIRPPKRDRSDLIFSYRFLSFSAAHRKSLPLRSDPLPPLAGARMAALTGEGSMAARFWIASRKESLLAKYTPFVVLLGAGKLDMDAFRNYIAQDVYFLRAFAQAYEMAAECADDDDAKVALNELREAVLNELKMHSSIIQEWGIDPNKEINPCAATLKYTEFLLATAAGKIEGGKGHIVTPFEKTKIAAYTLGAMTPCMRLYAFLGKELQLHLQYEGSDHPYKKWIDTYSSTSFEASAVQIEDLLDRLSISLTGAELEIIEKLYGQAMKLEIEFFNAQPVVQPVVVPFIKLLDTTNHLVIFSDFDLTCTVLDSCAILAEIAILTASKVGQSAPDGPDSLNAQRSPSDVRNSWDILSQQYTEEHEHCIKSIFPSEQAKTFDYESLCKSLEQLSDFEKRANSRVIESGLLKGLNLEDIKRAGERLILHDGCKEFFQKAINIKENFNADFHILSYCWCADLIRSAFASVGCLNNLSIHSNEFNYEGSISTGEIVRMMESPLDKAKKFRSILANLGKEKRRFSIYIGDSVGDLLCLLEADVGIVIGSSSSLRRVGEKFGVSFTPLYPGLIKKQREVVRGGSNMWKGLSGVLYTVSSWTEIHAFILGA
ncbi:putative aminopyrimidine aminohydrolase, mitochondrial [Canna indica]|uniref:Aminopyrimidine aminohydrolase, mitochondrial n=1 Tax=Canna indica TaxID=4628 RepID=A0AAQ3L8W9_9LILI|nr:putative aminopyrimidine aminohydrolase, mitochondrial [Canna indica]